jgi:alpha-galactosidase
MDIQLISQIITVDATDYSPIQGGYIAAGSTVSVTLARPPKSFYRHGWQSWTLTTWMSPNEHLSPISAHQTRAKDEDPPYAYHDHPVSAWVGASEMEGGRIVLLGALELAGRIEMIDNQMRGFYEDGHLGKWLISEGSEEEVFKLYSNELEKIFGVSKIKPPRVWCSWYSLYNTINEQVIDQVLHGLDGLPFDVIQIDDGWQISLGEWEANKKFPSGMKTSADKIRATGRKAGVWLSPFIISHNSIFAREHQDWLLYNEKGTPVYAGIGWSGGLNALDSSHPDVLEWLDKTIRKVVNWGFTYLKLDFLYAAALPGLRKRDIPRESAYRQAMQVIRNAAGRDTYILACGAPILPILGICDGIRIGPDVAPFWQSKPLSVWLNNPNHPGLKNGIRTSLHRLWLKNLINIDPDVVYFRSRHNQLTSTQKQLLLDLALITSFKATSDLPRWLKLFERKNLFSFLEEQPKIVQLARYKFNINHRIVDFSSIIPLPEPVKFPSQIALMIGLVQMGWYELIPGLIESFKARIKSPRSKPLLPVAKVSSKETSK